LTGRIHLSLPVCQGFVKLMMLAVAAWTVLNPATQAGLKENKTRRKNSKGELTALCSVKMTHAHLPGWWVAHCMQSFQGVVSSALFIIIRRYIPWFAFAWKGVLDSSFSKKKR
jgi:hypothetical protein